MGIDFPNPVGLAAGLDKNGDHIDALGKLGFGFIEVGTVTPKAQPGNDKPRMFRLPAHQALINRMGFNNKGVDHLVNQVAHRRWSGVLGINIGKNLATPVEHASDDYLTCLRKVYEHADYIAVNISSPNTPGLRNLQLGELLHELLAELKSAQIELADKHQRYVPLAVKVAPDMHKDEIDTFCTAVKEHNIDGVIATNTTASRSAISDSERSHETGGLSGQPLTTLARDAINQLYLQLQSEVPLIGCGGIVTGNDAVQHAGAGAQLVQMYTGLIYRGPALVMDARNALRSTGANSR